MYFFFVGSRESSSPDGRVTFVCGVIVLHDATPATGPPPPDVATSLGHLLESGDGSDVAFAVGGETFRAHRAVLAARSPVLRAGLLDSMAEATTPTVTLRDIEPETFGAMLRFMYTDTLPAEVDGERSPSEDFFLELLAAADRYSVDMLKVVYAQRLRDMLSVDKVGAILICAEVHGCSELKNKFLEFFVDDKNFKKVVLTEGYLQLIQSFSSLVDEIKARSEEKDERVLQEKKGSKYFDSSVVKVSMIMLNFLVAQLEALLFDT
ncbi:BTB/POZ and MATH domain-containing protein 1-like [Miscanthus floridulus]|uniref:BTB/POZ and MATH domain-containing protein 1-like n=1 Tax=Miscanthus floridulus TaxID=154761 RepID=UPI00345818EC